MTSTSFNTGYSLSRNSSKVIQPPGGQTADIFGRTNEGGSMSSASSQAGSDVASSRIRIDTDQQSIASSNQMPVDGIVKQAQTGQQQSVQQQQLSGGQMSPTGSVGSSIGGGGQQQLSTASSLVGDAFQPTMQATAGQLQQQLSQQQQQYSYKQQQLIQQQQLQQQDATRTPKKTIPVLRRNPITGEILENPGERQQPVVRVRQPPGGHSSGIF